MPNTGGQPLFRNRAQAEPESSHPGLRVHANPASSRLDQLLDDGETDAPAALGRVTRLFHAIEALEKMRKVAGRDRITAVSDRHHNRLGFRRCSYPDVASIWRIPSCVLQQTSSHL